MVKFAVPPDAIVCDFGFFVIEMAGVPPPPPPPPVGGVGVVGVVVVVGGVGPPPVVTVTLSLGAPQSVSGTAALFASPLYEARQKYVPAVVRVMPGEV